MHSARQVDMNVYQQTSSIDLSRTHSPNGASQVDFANSVGSLARKSRADQMKMTLPRKYNDGMRNTALENDEEKDRKSVV